MSLATIVYAYDRAGTVAAGFTAIGLLAPAALAAPVAGVAADGDRPNRVFVATFAASTVLLTLAAFLASSNAAPALVTVPVSMAVACVAMMRPALAVVMPGFVRSPAELTRANVRFTGLENAAGLVGPLIAAGLLAVAGPTATLAATAVINALALVSAAPLLAEDRGHSARAARGRTEQPTGLLARTRSGGRRLRRFVISPALVFRANWATAGGRPSLRPVLVVAGGHLVLVGSLDLLVVLVAREELRLGRSGPAMLSASFGAGSVVGVMVARRLVDDRPLGPLVNASLAAMTMGMVVLGLAHDSAPIVAMLLALIGVCRAVLSLGTRLLAQRAAPVQGIAAMFAVTEVIAAAAMIAGSVSAQVLVATWGVGSAAIGIGVMLAVLLGATLGRVRGADGDADMPVFAIRALRNHVVFNPLSPDRLEAVARSARNVRVRAGEAVIREGDVGEHFYLVAAGELTVDVSGEQVRVLSRGASFGEVALLADVPRTASVVARTDADLLAVDRESFLGAVLGHDAARAAARSVVRGLRFGTGVDDILARVPE
jgi:hypothetical protein